MRTFQAKRIASLKNDKGVAKRLADAVKLCRNKSYWVPAAVLVAAGIDRFAGGEKIKYLRLLKTEFPGLCDHLSPAEFYSQFRNGLIHKFSPKIHFALANDAEIGSEYVAEVAQRGTKRKMRALNVDRLISDFLNLARKRSS